MNLLVMGLVQSTATESFFFWLGLNLMRFFGTTGEAAGFGAGPCTGEAAAGTLDSGGRPASCSGMASVGSVD
jgi:hypothetical protein